MKNKKALIIVGIVVALILVYIIAVVTGNTVPVENSNDSGSSSQYGWEISDSSEAENSTARVDEIVLKAMNDANKISESDAKAVWNDAFTYLKDHSENFYENNEVMEKSMYYGTFIYKYIEATKKVENISELDSDTQNAYNAGYYTVNSIKYVYRGAENIEDESTQNSLKKAQEALL